jgi:hypothetical protein
MLLCSGIYNRLWAPPPCNYCKGLLISCKSDPEYNFPFSKIVSSSRNLQQIFVFNMFWGLLWLMPPPLVPLVCRGLIYAPVTLIYIYSFKSLISSFYPEDTEMVWRAKEEITLSELITHLKVCGVWGCSTWQFDLLLSWMFLYNIFGCIKSFVLHGHKY